MTVVEFVIPGGLLGNSNEEPMAITDEKEDEKVGQNLDEVDQIFSRDLLNFNTKKEILTLSITHPSQEAAKKILDIVIYEYNSYVRNRDILKASRSIELLREEIAKTQSSEVKLVLSNYLFQDLRKLQLSEISNEYAFAARAYSSLRKS